MKRILLILYLLPVCIQLNAQEAENHQIQRILDSLQKTNGFPGVAFCAILPDQKKIVASAGWADSLQQHPMLPHHRMLSGSNGKTLFAAAALKLASEGHYHLDDKISKYLSDEPWFKRLPNAKTITMRMLLNHTTGLEEYYGLGNFMELVRNNPERSFSPIETFSYLFDRKPLFEAGTSWGYADTNFILMGYILEKVTGKKMYEWVQTHLIQPYDLTLTEPSLKMSFENLATGYGRKNSPFPFDGAMVKKGKLVFNPQFEWMGGGFVSNVQDLASWTKSLYSLSEIRDDIREEMQYKVAAKTGKNHGYGLGIQIRPSEKLGTSYGHSGWFPGYLTDAVYFPEKDIALAIQFNTDDVSKLKMVPYEYLILIAEVLMKY
jgi:D-alanyl-D-alanine carboxypeptidase